MSIDRSDRDVFAATGNAIATPENYRYSEAVVDLYQTPGRAELGFAEAVYGVRRREVSDGGSAAL